MRKKPRLLQSFIRTLHDLPGYDRLAPPLEQSFDLVAARRPDLLSRGLFAEKGRSTVQLELVLREALKELQKMASEAENPDEICAPDLSNLRFNHTTGRLHVGHGSRSAYVFSRSEPDDESA